MTQENLPTPRTYDIIDNLAHGLTHQQTADKLNISLSTVARELRDIRENKDLQAWIVTEWLSLHGKVKQDNPVECYRALTSLIKHRDDGVKLTQNNIRQIVVTFGDSLHVVDNDKVSVDSEKEQQSEAITIDKDAVEEPEKNSADSPK